MGVSNDATRKQVLDEAFTWEGTPYHHRAAVKGAGVDCGMFPLMVYGGLGLLTQVDIPEYSVQWHLHQSEEVYLQTVEKLGGRPTTELLPANFVVFKIGRTFSHGAIIVKWPEVIHSLHPRGVILSDATIESKLVGRPMRIFDVWADSLA